MKILNILMIGLCVFLYRCSSSEVESDKKEKELVSEVEQSLDNQAAPPKTEDNLFFDEKTDLSFADTGTDYSAAPVAAASAAAVMEEAPAPVEEMAPASEVKISEAGEYIVEKGDTLLLISFKVYGDYRKWRSILAENPGISPDNLKAGTILKYVAPENKFYWNKKGNPHLVLRGDTLMTISNTYYGTHQRWKEILNNNQPMILDPNLIFAGFTIYYVPDKVASN